VDSTILMDAVATQDTGTQLIAADPPGRPARCPAAAEVIVEHCTAMIRPAE